MKFLHGLILTSSVKKNQSRRFVHKTNATHTQQAGENVQIIFIKLNKCNSSLKRCFHVIVSLHYFF